MATTTFNFQVVPDATGSAPNSISMLINGILFPRQYRAILSDLDVHMGEYVRIDPIIGYIDRTLCTTHYSNILIDGTAATSAEDALTKLNTTFGIGAGFVASGS